MGWWNTASTRVGQLLAASGDGSASHGVAHSVFDSDYVENEMNPMHALICLTCVILVANTLEIGMHWLEHRFSEWPHYARLLNKVYKELMILGIISFLIFIGLQSRLVSHNQYLFALEFTHFLVFMVALVYCFQSAMLLFLIQPIKRGWDLADFESPADLCQELEEDFAKVGGGAATCSSVKFWCFYRYQECNRWGSTREHVEWYLMKTIFLKLHQLPGNFDFATYMHESLMVLTTELVIIDPSTWTIFLLMAWCAGAVFIVGAESGGADRQALDWWIVPINGCVLLMWAYAMLLWSRSILDSTLRTFGFSNMSMEEMFLSVLKAKEVMAEHDKQFTELQSELEKNYGNRKLYDAGEKNTRKVSKIETHNAFKVSGIKDQAAKMVKETDDKVTRSMTRQKTLSKVSVTEGEAVVAALAKVDTHPAVFHKILDILILMLTFYISVYFTHYVNVKTDEHIAYYGLPVVPWFIVMFFIFPSLVENFTLTRAVLHVQGSVVGEVNKLTQKTQLIRKELWTKLNDKINKRSLFTSMAVEDVLDELFREMDKSGDGHVSYKEMEACFTSLKMFFSAKEIANLFRVLDEDASGSVDCEELRRFMATEPDGNTAPVALSAYQKLKKDRNRLQASKGIGRQTTVVGKLHHTIMEKSQHRLTTDASRAAADIELLQHVEDEACEAQGSQVSRGSSGAQESGTA